MYISLKSQLDTIKKDVDKIGLEFTKQLSKHVVKDLTDVHKQIISDFYNSYIPDEYVRTNNLKNSIIPQNPMQLGKRGYTSGIVVGSFNMFDNYNISPDNVFDLFWNKGVRGLPKVGTRILDDGDRWYNPTWVSQYGERENVFRTQVVLGLYISKIGTPHQIMKDITENWGDARGISLCDEIYKKIKV